MATKMHRIGEGLLPLALILLAGLVSVKSQITTESTSTVRTTTIPMPSTTSNPSTSTTPRNTGHLLGSHDSHRVHRQVEYFQPETMDAGGVYQEYQSAENPSLLFDVLEQGDYRYDKPVLYNYPDNEPSYGYEYDGPRSSVPMASPRQVTAIDIAQCTCDLTAEACDVNCCCDPDCTDDDRSTFSHCKDFYSPVDSQMCVSSNIIFRDNSPFTVNETTNGGLFCVVTDNYEERNYYNPPTAISSESEFETYIDRYAWLTSYKKESIQSTINAFYKSGDAILTVYETETLGFLSLPKSQTTATCLDTNYAAYLFDENNECVREINQLEHSCNNDLMLNQKTYYNGFKVIAVRQIYTIKSQQLLLKKNRPEGGESVPDILNQTNVPEAIVIEPAAEHICITDEGFNVSCEIKDIFFDGQCRNVVKKVHYIVVTDGTNGIVSATVQFTFTNVTSSQFSLFQGFQIDFTEEADVTTHKRSGNPGYVVGKPLLSATIKSVPDSSSSNNRLELDRSELSIVTTSATGQCGENPNNRIPIAFGEDMLSGCNFRLSYNNMSNGCDLAFNLITNALLGPNSPTYVATFGNITENNNLGDWVRILSTEQEPPTRQATDTTAGVCSNMIMSMHIEVLYANAGSLANPQAKIVGVRRVWGRRDIQFQCTGAYCQPETLSLTQNFPVTSSVSFIDVSEPAVGVSAEKPTIDVRLPSDFFYPFS